MRSIGTTSRLDSSHDPTGDSERVIEPIAHVDEALVRRARGGDREAQLRLAERINRVLEARARGFLRRNPRAWTVKDMVQDAWSGLLANDYARLMRWRHDGGRSLESFAAHVAKGLWINAMVNEDRDKRGGGVEHVHPDFDLVKGSLRSSEDQVLDADFLGRLWTFLVAKLPARGVLVLRLVFTDELKPDEAAAVLGVSGQVIHNWIFRIRTLAREFLAGDGGEPDGAK